MELPHSIKAGVIVFALMFAGIPTGNGDFEEGFIENLFPNTSQVEKSLIADVRVTAYSSTPEETWGDPFITASGERVRDGIIASNFLPFDTEVQIPEIFGDKVFIVKDRMHPRKKNFIDIWMPAKQKAINFGIHDTYIVVLDDDIAKKGLKDPYEPPEFALSLSD